MPFVSSAQRKKFQELVDQGKMSQETYNKWESETANTKLPEKLGPKSPKGGRKVRVK